MQDYFKKISDLLFNALERSEILILNFDAEETDFVRYNKSKIRQAGRVNQVSVDINLIKKGKTLRSSLRLSTEYDKDKTLLVRTLFFLRREVNELPKDPYLIYEKNINSSNLIDDQGLNAQDMSSRILDISSNHDMVGILSSGKIIKGFANSLGQFNWHESESFNFDWSLYDDNGKAIKQNYADRKWNQDTFTRLYAESAQQLSVISNEEQKVKPGSYRVYLSPSALNEIIDMMSWGGFSYKANKIGSSPLHLMAKGDREFDRSVSFSEDLSNGISPKFHSDGFIKPDNTELIAEGKYQKSLVSPRSALEYSVKHNAAEDYESPVSIKLETGQINSKKILENLGTGIYLNNLWYLNFSDRNNARVTGLTRFGCFYVKEGELIGPINTMRFDETMYNIFGTKLAGLTNEQQLLMDTSTYEQRSVHSSTIPGAVVEDFRLTL